MGYIGRTELEMDAAFTFSSKRDDTTDNLIKDVARFEPVFFQGQTNDFGSYIVVRKNMNCLHANINSM